MATTKKPAAEAAPAAPDTVLLRNLDSQGSQPFTPDHAERLLALPGTRWATIGEGNGTASAAKTAPAADSPDATGHSTEV